MKNSQSNFFQTFFFIIFFLNIFISSSFSNTILYFILTDRFFDGNSENNFNIDKTKEKTYHGGDLAGIIQKIDYLKNLGINAIWISPIYDNRDNEFFGAWAYHGYWVKDFENIEEHFGSINELKKLSDELHKNNIKLILDIVLNHTEWDAPLTQNKDFFHNKGDIKNWNNQEELETHNLTGLPDLNQENEEVYNYLLNNTKYWIKTANCDGIRLDAVKHIPHNFWKRFLKDIKNYVKNELHKNDFLIIGEVLNGDVNYLNEYFKDGFDYLFDFPLYYTLVDVFKYNNSSMHALSIKFNQDIIYENEFGLSPFLDNHDVARFFNDDTDLFKCALGLIFFIRGFPTIYYGTEVPLSGFNETDSRKDMFFNENSELYKFIALLALIRKNYEVFNNGQQIELYVDDDIYAFTRINESEEAIIIINKNSNNKNIQIPLLTESCINENLVDLINLKKCEIAEKKLNFLIDAKSIAVFVKECEKNIHKNYIEKIKEEKRKIKTESSEYQTYKIKVKNDKTKFGEQIYIVGSINELGNWDPKKSIGPMKCPNWPEWEIEIKLPPKRIIEFKFIVKDEKGNIKWESGNNRIINTSTQYNTNLEFIFNQ